jgi:hypothetical protein
MASVEAYLLEHAAGPHSGLRLEKPSGDPSSPAREPGALPDAQDQGTDGDGEALVCKACRYPITTASARIEAFGAHLHDRMNLYGHVFRIRLFAVAPGSMCVTSPSADFPWFPGHLWQIAVCRSCIEHLGWLFSGPSRFFGLLPEKLTPLGRPPLERGRPDSG